MLTEKANVLCLLKVLEEHSDQDHILPMREVISKVNALYDIKMDRRTIWGALEVLSELGYDICGYKENKIGYYLRERPFEISEVRLLQDGVLRSPFISAAHTIDLVKKLQALLSVHQRKKYRNLFTDKQAFKTLNKDVFYNIDCLEEAIEQKHKVCFTYLEYGFDKKLKPRRRKKYTASPYAMLCSGEQYYLAAGHETYDDITYYRLDRMHDIELTEEKRKPPPADFNVYEAVSKAPYMFAEEPAKILIRCDNSILDYVFERFGLNVTIKANKNDTFDFSITASPSGVKFWALQFLNRCELLEPNWLRQEISDDIKNSAYYE